MTRSEPLILFADDDQAERELVERALQQAGMRVLLARSGRQALELWRQAAPDLVLLDIHMPPPDGLEVCRQIRGQSQVPIMLLTGQDSEQTVIQGFQAGADDYMIKPFRIKELAARIEAILQRVTRLSAGPAAPLAHADLEVDLRAQRVNLRGAEVPTTPLERQLLAYFMQRAGAAISKEDLFRDVWGYAVLSGDSNTVEVAVRRLREKIEDDPSHPRYIHTIRGAGYRFGA